MVQNKLFSFLVVCIWLIPFASIQFLFFGVPIYPLEIVLLGALPFFVTSSSAEMLRVVLVRRMVLGAGALLLGVLVAYGMNPHTLVGLGQIKSFFVFPMLFGWLSLSCLLYREYRTRSLWHVRMMTVSVAGVALIWSISADLFTYDHRLQAWFDSPNLLAMLLLPGAVMWWVHGISGYSKGFLEKSALAVVTLTLILTRSYSVFGALIGALAFFSWVYWIRASRKPRYQIKSVGVVILSFLVLGLVFLEGRTDKWTSLVTGQERSSFSSRQMIWTSAIQMIADSPLFGIGPGRFQEVYLEYQRFYPPYLEWAVPHSHNFFLAIWLASGVLGVCVCLWLLWAFGQAVFCGLERFGREQSLSLTLLFGCLIVSIFDVPYFRADLCFLLWFELAFFAALFSQEETKSS